MERIEEPRGKPRGIFDRKEFCLFLILSLTPQQAAENALAIAVHRRGAEDAEVFLYGFECLVEGISFTEDTRGQTQIPGSKGPGPDYTQ